MIERPKFIRPAKGFRISISSAVQSYIDAECKDDPNLGRLWLSMFARMKMTALREGKEYKEGFWTFIAEGALKLGVPTLQITFTHDMHTVYIKNAIVWQAGDEREDDEFD